MQTIRAAAVKIIPVIPAVHLRIIMEEVHLQTLPATQAAAVLQAAEIIPGTAMVEEAPAGGDSNEKLHP